MTEGKNTYFLSDAHLGAGYIRNPREHELRVVAMLDFMAKDAKAVYLLGDMVDFWFEYKYVVPRGFIRFFASIQRLSDRGIPVYWFKGNHDTWTQGYLAKELGVTVINENLVTDIDGVKFFLSHGDGLGKLPRSYSFLRTVFRNEFCRRIGAALHPRLLMGFGLSWSRHNRLHRLNPESKMEQEGLQQQLEFARLYACEHPDVRYFIIGHSHIAASVEVIKNQSTLVSLGDCFQQFTYGVFNGKKMEIKHFESAK